MVVMIAQSISGILVARFIEPTDMGIFLSASLVLTYVPFMSLGVNNGLNRQLPYLLRKEDISGSIVLTSTAWYSTLLSSWLILFVLLLFSLKYFLSGDTQLALAFVAVSIIAFCNLLTNHLETLYRSEGLFVKLSKIKFIKALTAVLTIPVVYFLGFYGLLVRAVILGLIYLVILNNIRIINSGFVFSKKSFKELIKIGFPIFIAGYIYSFFTSMDRLLIIQYLGTEELGFYMPAILIKSGLMVLPTSIFQVIYPKMCNVYGQTGDPKSLVRIALKPLPFLTIALLPIFVIGWFLVEPFINFVLPQYEKGITAAQWVVVLTYFQCLGIHQDVLTILNKIPSFIIATCFGILMSLFLIPELMQTYAGVQGASMGQAFSILVINLIMLFMVIYYIYYSKNNI